MRLVIAKATEGTSFRDPTFPEHRRVAKACGLGFGAYLFLHAASSGDEAGFFLDYAQPAPGELVVIDAEGGGLDGRPLAALAVRVRSCQLALEKQGRRPVLYSSASTWLGLVRAQPQLRALRVWEAQYPGRFTRWLPRLATLRERLGHGASVVLWQWTDTLELDGAFFDCSRIMAPLDRMAV